VRGALFHMNETEGEMKRAVLGFCALALLIVVCAGCTTDLAVSNRQDPARVRNEGPK
jgi:hypothetical protein